MDEVKQAIDKMEQTAIRNQRETRKNLDKIFIHLSRLEVAIGKLNVQLELEKEHRGDIKDEITVAKDRIRRIEVVFLPVALSIGAVIAWLSKKFGS